MIVENELKLDPFEKALFIFSNRQINRIKILHFDAAFLLYYYRLENTRLKWTMTTKEALTINKEEILWLLNCSSRIPIISYDYTKIRSSSCHKNFLKDFSGYLQTDGY